MVFSVKKKFYAHSSARGCLTNLLETSTIRNSLNSDLFERADSPEEADVIVVNTCGYNNQAEKTSLDTISELQSKYPGKKLIVSGCLPRINSDALQATFKGDVVRTGDWARFNEVLNEPAFSTTKLRKGAGPIDTQDLGTRLPQNRLAARVAPILKLARRWFPGELNPLYNIIQSLVFDDKTYAIEVARGCLGRCTYCAIKRAKGRLVSKPLHPIVEEFQRALSSGFTKFHLVGDDVGCWGQDIGLDSSELLRALLRSKGDFQIIINYFDPTWLVRLFENLEEPLSDPRIICVNIPIQSGSDRVVKMMERDYKVDHVLSLVEKIKRKNPNLIAKTHLMSGYPGETRQDFRKSLRAIKRFDLLFPNQFGPRPGTPAANLEQISGSTSRYRFNRLKASIALQHAKVVIKSLASPLTGI